MTRIIGIDPGSRIAGYGLIEINNNQIQHIDCGGIHIPTSIPLEERLLFLHEKLIEIIEEFRPCFASIEDVFFAKNAKSALMLGHVRGVILLSLAQFKIPCHSYPPREIKKAITGYGAATKEQVQYMVKQILKLKEKAFEDASDALATAICHSNTLKLQNRLIKK